MDTTVIALKALYAALGGTATDVEGYTIIPDMVNAIASLIASGATKELPEVTAANNGAVLKVVSGEWAIGTDNT